MNIPKRFILHYHPITVKIKEIDNTDENRYGYYDSAREEIIIFRKLKSDGKLVELTDIQLEATFYHELLHAFQWHIKGETDEIEAQSYSGLILEFLNTREFNERD